MKLPVKAALLSAFVFPGVGHFLLKKYVVGALLSGTALVALYVVVSYALERALTIVEKLQSGEAPLDIAAMTELVSRQEAAVGTQSTTIATIVLTIVWLAGIVDAYRLGSAQDHGSKSKTVV